MHQQLLNCCVQLIILINLSSGNPYRRNVELFQREPNSGISSVHYSVHKSEVEELWITQKLDHFNETNNEMWQQRYFRNSKHHKPGGPIFIFVGGEWMITPGLMLAGLTHNMAAENMGMLYYTEHRYYGKSWPSSPDNLTNFEHLNLLQALADLAHFIEYQKSHSSNLTDSKVILVGGSYSGSMVTWMMELYPELITASWASSAPLLAKADFYEYMEMVANSINITYGSQCVQRIEKGLKNIENLLSGTESDILLKRLNACTNFNTSSDLDRAAFFNGIGNYFALIVQSYSSYIPKMCDILLNLHSDDEMAMLRFLDLLYANDIQNSKCVDFSYSAMLAVFKDPAEIWTGTRIWFHQTCTEFGWYTTTASSNTSKSGSSSRRGRNSSFGNVVPLSYFHQLCRDAFGVEYTPALLAEGIAKTNKLFGGYDFDQSVRYQRVLFTHGELDPWRAMGRQKEGGAGGKQVVVIPGYSHVEDLAGIDVKDSIPMNLAKLHIMSFLRQHLQHS